jgi:hypothetical protein
MAHTAQVPTGRREREAEVGFWGAFAGCMLFLAGTFSFLYGLGAVLNDEAVTVGGNGGVIVWDFTLWGWVHIVLGAVMVAVSVGLFTVKPWARWGAVVFATLNAIAQVTIITAFPIYALIVIALDVIVIYQLTARWYRD